MKQHLQRQSGVANVDVSLIDGKVDVTPKEDGQIDPAQLLKAMLTITGAVDARRKITRQSLLKTPPTVSRIGSRKPPASLAPDKISLARLPVTGSEIFGREEDITFLDRAWAKKEVNVVIFTAFRE